MFNSHLFICWKINFEKVFLACYCHTNNDKIIWQVDIILRKHDILVIMWTCQILMSKCQKFFSTYIDKKKAFRDINTLKKQDIRLYDIFLLSGLQYISTSVIIHLHFPTKLFSVRTIRKWIVVQENFLHGNVSTLYIKKYE